MKYFYLLIITLSAALLNPAAAQPIFPEDGPLYSDDGVARIDITINPDTLAWLYKPENQQSDLEWRAEFVFDNGTLRDTIHEIGFRLRGNTSRASAKKSFKVSFNTYQSGRKYYGVEKLNLNGEHNDPTVARAKISWELCHNAGIAAPRSSFVRLYINGSYHGLYINVEHIDEEFVDKRYGSQDGNLYKCLYPADLNYLGNDPDIYKFMAGDRRAYELKTNKAADDYSDLAHFIDVLNNTPIADLPCELEKVFNVQDYLKVAAMDVMTANWDGYIFNKNNYYLYDNPATGRFEYIPYDLDNTCGIDWFGINWSMRNIYDWGHDSESRPLYERLMQVPEYRDWFSYYVSQMSTLMTPSPFFERLEVIKDQNYPFIINDPFYPLDYGYTPANFLSAFTNGTGAHVPVGITEYVTNRYASAANQLQLNNITPIVNYLAATHYGAGGSAWFEATVTDDDPVEVALLYQINNGDWQTATMTAGDDARFSAEVNLTEETTMVSYQISAADTHGHTTLYPCDPKTMIISPASGWPLFINELLASNDTGITDEAGEHDDWLEIYNAGDDPIWLGDKYLSDNFVNPGKWPMPDYTIQPGEFLLVWCDEDQEQGVFHTNFKLSKGGEEVGIFDAESTGFAPIDALTFPAQETDISYGRLPDGTDLWKHFIYPTPGISNLLSVINDQPTTRQKIYGFPNPVEQGFLYLNKTTDFTIYDQTGRAVAKATNSNRIDTESLPSGLYLLHTAEGMTFKFIKN
jgi:hypothetical protein